MKTRCSISCRWTNAVPFLDWNRTIGSIVGEPVVGSVFERLMTDILDKQRQNLSHALSRYRESEGTLDPHALLDNALDVRGLIDHRLLLAEAAGRWSTRPDPALYAQPATVRAESAKQELSLLNSVEQALDQLLEKHPAIPATTRTFAEAQSLVSIIIGKFAIEFYPYPVNGTAQ